MLHGVTAENEIELLRDGVSNQVVNLKLPGPGFTKVATMSLDVARYNVIASEVNVRSLIQEAWHPGHVTTGRVKQSVHIEIWTLVR